VVVVDLADLVDLVDFLDMVNILGAHLRIVVSLEHHLRMVIDQVVLNMVVILELVPFNNQMLEVAGILVEVVVRSLQVSVGDHSFQILCSS
jgi:hypothetical protein